jgi:hypothetical protein
MTDIEKEFGFELGKVDWSKCGNKACTHGYPKNMNQPRFDELSNTDDLGFSDSDNVSSLKMIDIDTMMADISDEL